MTTSLPTTSANDLLPAAANALAANAPLADGFAALFGAATPASNAAPGTAGEGAATFTALLDGNTAATPATSAPPPMAVAPTAVVATSVVPTNSPSPSTAQGVMRPTVGASAPLETPPATTDARGLAFRISETGATPSTSEVAPDAPIETARPESETSPALPDRETLEAIVALLAPVVALVSPAQPTVALGETAPSAAGDTVATPAADVPTRGGRSSDLPAGAQIKVALPGRDPVVLDETLSPAAVVPAALSPETPAASPTREPAAPAAEVAASAPAVAPTRSQVVARSMPMPNTASTSVELPAPLPSPERAATESLRSQPQPARLEISAAVELTSGAVVSIESPSPVLSGQIARENPAPSAADVAVVSVQPEKSAAATAEKNAAKSSPENVVGKNFLTAETKSVKSARGEDGIGVAQTRSTMLFPLHDPNSAAHPTVPALVSMVPVAAEVAAAPAAEPMPPLVAASCAHRAVETVTSVVDAQAASKLQPVPSVQLKFKFGAEDLAVRVALRDGVVTTEFRTDSPELRAAIQNEWKAVTAQPEGALRYLDPVVAPASSSQSGTNSFAQQHQQQSSGQSAAQQQQQQQHSQTRAAAEFFGSVARSTPFQPRDGGAASNVAPIALPTSVHLSAVA